MKTKIDVPDDQLEELLRNTHAKTHKKAVLTAIEEYNRRKRMGKLTDYLGTFEDFMSPDELKAMRKDQ